MQSSFRRPVNTMASGSFSPSSWRPGVFGSGGHVLNNESNWQEPATRYLRSSSDAGQRASPPPLMDPMQIP